jgi:hypothetical protein
MATQLAGLLAERGDATGAAAALARADALLAGSGDPLARSAWHQQAATLALGRGQIAAAAAHADAALALSAASSPAPDGDTPAVMRTRLRAQALAGRVAEAAGDSARADTCFQAALPPDAAPAPADLVRELAQSYAEILTARGAHAAASRYYRLALAARPTPPR